MSTVQSDLEQNSSIDSETDVSSMTSALCVILQNSSIHSETDVSSMTSGEQLGKIGQSSPTPHEESGTPKMSTLQSGLEQNSSVHSVSDVSSVTSGEQLGDIEQSSPTPHEQSDDEEGWKRDLCHAICVNSWNDAKAILDQNPKARTAKINVKGRTALHVAAMFGRVTIVKELLKLVPSEFLSTTDFEHHTALTLACEYSGCAQVAKWLVNKNRELLGIPIGTDLPVTRAIKLCHIKMGRYLYYETPLKHLKGQLGSEFLRYCFKAQCLDIALDLLQRWEELLLVPRVQEGLTPIHYIASLNTTNLSPGERVFWKRWIYDWHGLIPRLVTTAYNFVGVKKIQDQKMQHEQAAALLRLVCKNARKAPLEVMYQALQIAAREGNGEFVSEVSDVIPEIFTSRTFFTCLNEALDNRHAEIFNIIHGFRFKNVVLLNSISSDEDTMLHRAAIKASDDILSRLYSPTVQMQKELQWFKEVENLIPPEHRGFRNKRGMTGKQLFRESHRELMKEAEEWIKQTGSACSVVGTLVVGIMFAAAFSVPGGYDQTLGYPLLIKQRSFKVFIVTTIFSLLSSTASVLIFLVMLTSPYSENKFLKSLPEQLLWGLSLLFTSIICMIIAFLSTIDLMMKHTHYSWGVLPISILASVPIFFYVLRQYPLLLHTYVSTYGNTFDRKLK